MAEKLLRLLSMGGNSLKRNLSIRYHVPVTETHLLPPLYNQELIPGSTAYGVSGEFGTIGMQSITAAGISYYYVSAQLTKPMYCSVRGTDGFFFVLIHFAGKFECRTVTSIHIFNQSNHYNVAHVAGQELSFELNKQPQLKCLLIAYPVSYIQSILHKYPWLEEIENLLKNGQNYFSEQTTLHVALSERVYHLLHTPYAITTENYFYRLFGEIIEVIFTNPSSTGKKVSQFSIYEVGCIHNAKDYIDTNLREHITIASLSRHVGINQLKLKKGFKEIFGIGVYGYQLQQRLLIAKMTLEKTMNPIRQIARQAGYKKGSNFSASFKRAFGKTPFQYRKYHRSDRL